MFRSQYNTLGLTTRFINKQHRISGLILNAFDSSLRMILEMIYLEI